MNDARRNRGTGRALAMGLAGVLTLAGGVACESTPRPSQARDRGAPERLDEGDQRIDLRREPSAQREPDVRVDASSDRGAEEADADRLERAPAGSGDRAETPLVRDEPERPVSAREGAGQQRTDRWWEARVEPEEGYVRLVATARGSSVREARSRAVEEAHRRIATELGRTTERIEVERTAVVPEAGGGYAAHLLARAPRD